IGINLDQLLKGASRHQVVVTDVRGHWASSWISRVTQAGVMDAFANHTFQPKTRVRRVDLAAAVSRLLVLAEDTTPALRTRLTQARPKIADVSAGHLSYSAVSLAV